MDMRFFVNENTDPTFNLALEELTTANAAGEIFMLWRNHPAVIVGRNQNTAAEINGELLRASGIEAVRRITGGGAVYHDLGNFNYSCISDRTGENFSSFERFARPVIAALATMGVEATFSGRNDITVAGRKISGGAKCFVGSKVLFHGTLLFDTDLTMLGQLLTPDPAKLRIKGISSVTARVANLREFLPNMTRDEFHTRLIDALLRNFKLKAPDPIPPELIYQAQQLARDKYRLWEWNYGISPGYDHCKKLAFAGGKVELALDLRKGKIENIRFSGDFFGCRPVEELEEILRGTEYRKEVFCKIIDQIELDDYIMKLSREDLISLAGL